MAKKAKKKPLDVAVAVTVPVPVASKKAKKKKASAEEQPMDAMSQCILFCQEQRWREALLLSKKSRIEAEQEGNPDAFAGMGAAETKIEYSLRRQMAGSLIVAAKKMLAKEYLLDVGE